MIICVAGQRRNADQVNSFSVTDDTGLLYGVMFYCVVSHMFGNPISFR